MLKFLQVKNFALAENLQVEFHPGLNIITGETGAGKSILVGAIAAVLGERVFTDIVRTGCEKALVEAVFDISGLTSLKNLLQERGIESGEELFLRREISTRGNTRAFVNDSPVTITTLAEIGNFLVDIHGQHEHQSLLHPETHIFFLDAYGRLQPLLDEVRSQYNSVKEIEKNLLHLRQRQNELNEKFDLFEFQLREINELNPEAGEDEKLEEERRLLANSEKLFEISSNLEEIISRTEFNLIDFMGQAERLLAELSNFSHQFQKLHEEFSSAKIVVEETSRTLQEFQEHLEFDPNRLEEIEARLNQIRQLKKKYGASIEEVLKYRDRVQQDIQLRENFDFELQKLQKSYDQAINEFTEAASQLSVMRKEVAVKLEDAIQKELNLLGMPQTRFRIDFQREEDPRGLFRFNSKNYRADENGADLVEFFISPNPGEDFKPLHKIASGGEISRIMLALKTILANLDEIPTLIFDEIDSGVSGRIAQAVGRSIYQLSRSRQILCITHLPQIASQGQNHFIVEKFVANGRTFTHVQSLNDIQRVEEIARLISGERITDTVRESARQLIEEGKV